MVKVKKSNEALRLQQIPNIGPAIEKDFKLIGILNQDIRDKDPVKLYHLLNEKTGQRHDPCVLDTFMAAVDFMNGGRSKPWWKFTSKRKTLKY